jgi:hypothetical protein
MKALIVGEPWISLILSGKKTWEMRTRATSVRGEIALIRKGSGQVVGTARLINSLPPLSADDYSAAEFNHRIPADQQRAAIAGGWRFPWVLANATPLPRPVPYRHPSGAVIWVNLDMATARAVPAAALSIDESHPAKIARTIPGSVEGAVGSEIVDLTHGNLKHHHIYLASAMHLFPPEAVGGANKTDVGESLSVTFVPGSQVETDIAGDKKIFRARGAVREFLERSGACAGDQVRIRKIGPREFRISLLRHRSAS